MKKKIWISIGVVILILGFVGFNVYKTLAKEGLVVDTVKVEEREITGNVMVPGTLSFSQEDFIYLDPENGEVSKVLVKEGDQVKVGTPLIRYENEQLQLEQEQNALSIESAYLRINQIDDQLDALDNKEDDLSKQVGDDEAKKTIDAERDQLKIDLKVANIEARQVQLQRETIEKQVSQLEIKSELAGTVLSIDEEAISGITQTPILHIGKVDGYVVKASISEYDSLKIKEKQAVILKSDVIPEKEWKGTVTKVGLLPEQTENAMASEEVAVQYPIEVSLEGEKIEIKPGFKLIMEIETEKRKAQAVPIEAVKQDGEKYYVFVVQNGKAIRKEVKTGVTSDQFMEIKTGLAKGEEVIKNPPENLQNDMEVSVR
jgi:HlyD family secretion protein